MISKFKRGVSKVVSTSATLPVTARFTENGLTDEERKALLFASKLLFEFLSYADNKEQVDAIVKRAEEKAQETFNETVKSAEGKEQ